MIRRIRKAVATCFFLVGALFFILGALVDSESYDRL